MMQTRTRHTMNALVGILIAVLAIGLFKAKLQIDALERRVNILMALTPGTPEKEILARIPHRLDVRTYSADNLPEAANLVVASGGHALNFDSYQAETPLNAAGISSIWVAIDKNGHCTGAYIQAMP
jgi:hypothetical protein